MDRDDVLVMNPVPDVLKAGGTLKIFNETKDRAIPAEHRLSDRQVELLIAGSLISYLRAQAA